MEERQYFEMELVSFIQVEFRYMVVFSFIRNIKQARRGGQRKFADAVFNADFPNCHGTEKDRVAWIGEAFQEGPA